jgi:hypothetical protein
MCAETIVLLLIGTFSNNSPRANLIHFMVFPGDHFIAEGGLLLQQQRHDPHPIPSSLPIFYFILGFNHSGGFFPFFSYSSSACL